MVFNATFNNISYICGSQFYFKSSKCKLPVVQMYVGFFCIRMLTTLSVSSFAYFHILQ